MSFGWFEPPVHLQAAGGADFTGTLVTGDLYLDGIVQTVEASSSPSLVTADLFLETPPLQQTADSTSVAFSTPDAVLEGIIPTFEASSAPQAVVSDAWFELPLFTTERDTSVSLPTPTDLVLDTNPLEVPAGDTTVDLTTGQFFVDGITQMAEASSEAAIITVDVYIDAIILQQIADSAPTVTTADLVLDSNPLQQTGDSVATVSTADVVVDASILMVAGAGFGVPTGLMAVAQSSTRIDVSWNAVTDATHYDLERDSVIISEKQTGLTYQDEGLDPGTEYTYRVRAARRI